VVAAGAVRNTVLVFVVTVTRMYEEQSAVPWMVGNAEARKARRQLLALHAVASTPMAATSSTTTANRERRECILPTKERYCACAGWICTGR
jgi:hypothetical protein